MLTWSDWKTEPRSNRYHYASRFAKTLPVYFVQPDGSRFNDGYIEEDSEIEGLKVVHVSKDYSRNAGELSRLLAERRIRRPLLWVYNPLFLPFVRFYFTPLKVYHATEDYFSPGSYMNGEVSYRISKTLALLLKTVDLLVCVSDDVLTSYRTSGKYAGAASVCPNGCDFKFWSAPLVAGADADRSRRQKVAIYQGGINGRLDIPFIDAVIGALPHVAFRFCGRVAEGYEDWRLLQRRLNFKYEGELTPDELRRAVQSADVGLMPFKQVPQIEGSFPLKAFEYVAAGLPVVSVPIRALIRHSDLFKFATTPSQFSIAIEEAVATRNDGPMLENRRKAAAEYDYDRTFARLSDELLQVRISSPTASARRLSVLVLYDLHSTQVPAIYEHLRAFEKYSRHNLFFLRCTESNYESGNAAIERLDLSSFDAVVIHFSVRLSVKNHILQGVAEKVRAFGGLKVCFIQDEYENTKVAWDWIRYLGLHVVYTNVPLQYIDRVYPDDLVRSLDFVHNLTGYVSDETEFTAFAKPFRERTVMIGYRGRDLPYWYGDLGQDKLNIGMGMRRACERRGVACDIEWETSKRVYGEDWFRFLGNARATLASESGSNVFDFDGSIRASIEGALRDKPQMTYDEARERFLGGHEGLVPMNQVSPRIFESIKMRNMLILFEGTYSGVVEPDVHFVPLKKDFSNADQVIDKAFDVDFAEKMANRAFEDVIGSGRYSYRRFIEDFDGELSRRTRPRHEFLPFAARRDLARYAITTGVPFYMEDVFPAYPESRIGYASMENSKFFDNVQEVKSAHSQERALERWVSLITGVRSLSSRMRIRVVHPLLGRLVAAAARLRSTAMFKALVWIWRRVAARLSN